MSTTETSNRPWFPHVEVQLSGQDGNAFFILGRVVSALEKAGVSEGEIDEFYKEATSGNYDRLLQTVMRWVSTR